MFTYKDLDTWKLSMDLVESCYRASVGFPATEDHGLTSQLRRAAVSIPCNIAEGHCRRTTKAYLHHVNSAIGSHAELETCVEICVRLELLSSRAKEKLLKEIETVGRLLNGLHRALKEKVKARRERKRTTRTPSL